MPRGAPMTPIGDLSSADFVKLTTGRRVVGIEMPPAFIVGWMTNGAKIGGLSLPDDVQLYLVLTDRVQYPGKMVIFLESDQFDVVTDRVPCLIVAPGPGVEDEDEAPERKPS